jgi:hypothetical protein
VFGSKLFTGLFISSLWVHQTALVASPRDARYYVETTSHRSSMHVIKPAVRQKIDDHGLSINEVEAVLAAPEQQVPGYSGRLVYQSRVGRFLIRSWLNTVGTHRRS